MKFSGVKALVLDVDGVLTDGSLFYTERGEELKKFNIKDGTGIKLLKLVGVEVAVITGKGSAALDTRFKELGLNYVFKNIRNKARILKEFSAHTNIALKDICFIADDIIDIPALQLVGFPMAVKDAEDEVLKFAKYITKRPGGYGAVREVANLILWHNDLWEEALKRYFDE